MERYYNFYRPILTDKNFSDLNPIDCGWAHCRPSLKNVAYRNHYVIHYIVKGGGTVNVKNKTENVKSGEIFFIKPDTAVTYTASKNEPWEYIWISLTGDLAKKIDKISEIKRKFDGDEFFEIKNCERYMSLKEEYLASLLFRIYIRLFSKKEKQNPVYAAKNYIDISYSQLQSLSKMAAGLGIDRHHLSRIFKQEFGISMQDYLIKKRMKEAKKLLHAGFNVSQTAFSVGYRDQFVFSKAFKKYYGISPSQTKKAD